MVAQWQIEPRRDDLARLDPIVRWNQLTIVERHNVAGTWAVQGRRVDLAPLWETYGRGVVISRDGLAVMSGWVETIDLDGDQATIGGWSDLAALGVPDGATGTVVFPVPASPWTNQTAAAYDVQTGPAETVLLHYINVNAGPSAYAGSGTANNRRVTGLSVPTSSGLGGTVRRTARFNNLAVLVADIAEAGGLHVDVVQQEPAGVPQLRVTVRECEDRTGEFRVGTPDSLVNALVSGVKVTITAPTATDAMVAGGGIGTARTQVYARDTAARDLWGGRIRETFVDQRQTTDATELGNAAADALADASAPVQVQFTVTDTPQVGSADLRVGDRIGALIYGIDLSNVLREKTTNVASQDGQAAEQVSAVLGSRDASAWSTVSQRKLKKALTRLAKLEAD